MIQVRSAPVEVLDLLKLHPQVNTSGAVVAHCLEFDSRSIRPFGESFIESDFNQWFGLIELADNNPLVCARDVFVPSPAGTLFLAAAGPVSEAGLVVAEPVFIVNVEMEDSELVELRRSIGLPHEVVIKSEAIDLGPVLAATALVEIETPSDWTDIDELFRERYERSFFIREVTDEEWDTKLVQDTAGLVYRLRHSPGESTSLLTIQVMADRSGKCGAAQWVHLFNVMNGFEESLAIS